MAITSGIREIDLLAYADGLLEADVARSAAVERHLADHPEAAAFVAEVRAQNEEIRACYGQRLYEPVPERLSAVLQRSGRPIGARRLARIAAGIALLAAAGLAGWMVGQSGRVEPGAPEDFVARAAGIHARGTAPGVPAAGGSGVMQPLGWLNQRIDLELAAPDLSAIGFALVAKEQLGSAQDRLLRLAYQRRDGTAMNLVLRPRWRDDRTVIRKATRGGVDVRYWQDGPLSVAMTSTVGDGEAALLSRAVRAAIGRARLHDGAPAMARSPGAGGAAQAAGAPPAGGLQPLLLAPPHGTGRPPVQVN